MPTHNALLYTRHIEKRSSQTDEILSELGYDTVLIHSGTPEMYLFDDQHPPFRAHAPFSAWIPQPRTPDCLLELRVGRKPRLWFCQPEDFWHLPPDPPAQWWADALDVETVASPGGWHGRFKEARSTAVIGRQRDLGHLLHDRADLNPPALLARMDENRTRKTAWERECIAQANRVAARAHRAAGAAFESDASELEIHLAYLEVAGQDQSDLPYNSIVALNQHAAILHYQVRSARRPDHRSSFLIDAGADHFGYAADVTRTWTLPEHSDFDDLIEAVDRAQLLLCEKAQPGVSFVELHRQAHLAMAGILEQAGLVNMSPDEMLATGVSSYFLPHGLGHFIGVQVHDVAGKVSPTGEPLPPPEEFPALRLTRELQPGNVVTIEPGIYFIPMLLDKLRASEFGDKVDWNALEELLPFGGIRIEDNVLVSETKPVNFTRQAFAELT
jgi:Xaa-Pro dipeptidase